MAPPDGALASAEGDELEENVAGRIVVPSPGSLRGLPVVGHGGTMRGTDPLAALMRKER